MTDYLNGMKLENLECLVAIDETGTGWIIARSDHIRETDILMECSEDDNGFNAGWNKDLSIGVYKVTIKPWSYQGYYDGEWSNGIDVVKIETLWEIKS